MVKTFVYQCNKFKNLYVIRIVEDKKNKKITQKKDKNTLN